MDIRLLALAAALPLAACAATDAPAESTPPPAAMKCDAGPAQTYVGQTVTSDLGAAILKATGARTLRWGPPRSAMTMDYRIDRVNVMYDDASRITDVTCG